VVYYNGDCRDLLEKIPDKSVRLVLTSPPYNLGKEYERKMKLDDYLVEQDQVISKCIAKVADNGSICWEVGNYVENSHIVPLDVLLYPLFVKHEGLKLRNRIVWYFGHGLHASKRFSGRYEVILWFTKSEDYVFNLDAVRVPQKYPQKKHYRGPNRGELSSNPLGKNPSDVWEIPNVKSNHPEKTEHPCQFPVELVQRLVLALTKESDWVLDPFMGVGSTAVGSILENRRVIGAEVERKYVQIGLGRVRKASQGKLKVRPMGKPIYEPPHTIKRAMRRYSTLDEVVEPALRESQLPAG
jgi:adenine-specific DNA-methyltransferase